MPPGPSHEPDIVRPRKDLSSSPLWSEDLAPVPPEKRTWNTWNLAAIWVGMAVCIPTYILASYMIKSGLPWGTALAVIGLANLIITLPMVLNGHAGVKYGIPFPVLGRAAFGWRGIHLPALVRAFVACGWFGVQTWIGGLAIWAIAARIVPGWTYTSDFGAGTFVSFLVFWAINLFFIWRGTESIKRLETWSAPILLGIGLVLIAWGASTAGGFGVVLAQSEQLRRPGAWLVAAEDTSGAPGEVFLHLGPVEDREGRVKAEEVRVLVARGKDTLAAGAWRPVRPDRAALGLRGSYGERAAEAVRAGEAEVLVRFAATGKDGRRFESTDTTAAFPGDPQPPFGRFIYWLTGMVGFWATMSLSIADITRYAHTQKQQIAGQFLGLPTTMMLYSFVGIFVTCAAVINFPDVLTQADAPWDPVSLLERFEHPLVVVFAQLCMIVATLSTNIAANVIAPANAFANLAPRRLSFRAGGLITGLAGIALMPWLLLEQISGFLVVVSAFLGPILGVMLADYWTVRRTRLRLDDLYDVRGAYGYGGSGWNPVALTAVAAGVGLTLVGLLVPPLAWLFQASWFMGFTASYLIYTLWMRGKGEVPAAMSSA